jgi:hypothetical protein
VDDGQELLMSADRTTGGKLAGELSEAIANWARNANERPLTRWLERELDSNGTPIRMSLPEWDECLNILQASQRERAGWPKSCDERITRMVRSSLRFTRPDGCLATCLGVPVSRNGPLLETEDRTGFNHSNQSTARGRKRWLAVGVNEGLPHASMGWASSKRVLAGLNDDGTTMRDLLVVDHHAAADFCRFELFGGGRSWLGPSWTLDGEIAAAHRPHPRTWISTVTADLAEWSQSVGDTRVTRSVLLLRGLRLALLSVLVERKSPPAQPPGFRIARPQELAVESIQGCRALVLSQSSKHGTAQVLPIGLPCASYATDQGRFASDGDDLVLSHAAVGRRTWLPLLVSWDLSRHRKRLHWRVLTVSERSRIVGADRAVAVRVSWGRHETYVIYRSLASSAPRVFLGHRSQERLLVGRFTEKGLVEPILEVE